MRFTVLCFILSLLVLSGCSVSKEELETQTRVVSSDSRGFGVCGLLVNEGGLKEIGVTFEDGPVTFEDSVIEEMLRNMLGEPEGDVLRSELQEIHAIYWRDNIYWSNLQSPDGLLPQGEEGPWETKQPETLVDLSLCDNLQWMEFGAIEVPSLQPLFSLMQLETVQFEGAFVTKETLEELSSLPYLKSLGIGNEDDWGSITDGSFLLPLADRLTDLKAAGKIQWNPEVLAQMTKLEGLQINNADDISFLAEMTGLKQLYIYACTATDWSALGSLQNLEQLAISGNMYITVDVTLDDLRQLTNLDYLELFFTTLQKQSTRQEIIDALPGLTGLYIM